MVPCKSLGMVSCLHSNYGCIFSHFGDIQRQRMGTRQSIAIPFGMEKLEWSGYPMVKKLCLAT